MTTTIPHYSAIFKQVQIFTSNISNFHWQNAQASQAKAVTRQFNN